MNVQQNMEQTQDPTTEATFNSESIITELQIWNGQQPKSLCVCMRVRARACVCVCEGGGGGLNAFYWYKFLP